MFDEQHLIIEETQKTRFLFFGSLREMWQTIEPQYSNAEILVIVDRKVNHFHGELLREVFPGISVRTFELPEGEASKSMEMWTRVMDFAFSGPLRRNTPLIAVGGGVAGDLAGFAASTLLRGLPLIHVPTTLLAMVDSAIGGKTGINHLFGKNTIGSFYSPDAVLFDTSFLRTLPEEEWLSGLSEVLKYGYIRDPGLLDLAVGLVEPDQKDESLLRQVIAASVAIKADIVSKDSKESGQRAYLNFGHTFAHALETIGGYGEISHGEAVYAGMIAALHVSRAMGGAVSDQKLIELKKNYALNLGRYTNCTGELVNQMRQDKKNRDSNIRLVLLRQYGRPELVPVSDEQVIRDAWSYTFETLA